MDAAKPPELQLETLMFNYYHLIWPWLSEHDTAVLSMVSKGFRKNARVVCGQRPRLSLTETLHKWKRATSHARAQSNITGQESKEAYGLHVQFMRTLSYAPYPTEAQWQEAFKESYFRLSGTSMHETSIDRNMMYILSSLSFSEYTHEKVTFHIPPEMNKIWDRTWWRMIQNAIPELADPLSINAFCVIRILRLRELNASQIIWLLDKYDEQDRHDRRAAFRTLVQAVTPGVIITHDRVAWQRLITYLSRLSKENFTQITATLDRMTCGKSEEELTRSRELAAPAWKETEMGKELETTIQDIVAARRRQAIKRGLWQYVNTIKYRCWEHPTAVIVGGLVGLVVVYCLP